MILKLTYSNTIASMKTSLFKRFSPVLDRVNLPDLSTKQSPITKSYNFLMETRWLCLTIPKKNWLRCSSQCQSIVSWQASIPILTYLNLFASKIKINTASSTQITSGSYAKGRESFIGERSMSISWSKTTWSSCIMWVSLMRNKFLRVRSNGKKFNLIPQRTFLWQFPN